MIRVRSLVFVLAGCLAILSAPAGAAEPIKAGAVASVQGAVEVQPGGAGSWQPALEGETLPPGSQVRTGADGQAVLAFLNGSKMELGPNSRFTIAEAAPRRLTLSLALGRFQLWVRKLSEAESMETKTPTAVAAVRGTVYTIDIAPDGTATFQLFNGRLEISDIFGRTMALLAGRGVVSSPGKGLGRPENLPPTLKPGKEPAVSKFLQQLLEASRTAAAAAAQQAANQIPATPKSFTITTPLTPAQIQQVLCGSNVSPSSPGCH